MLPFIIETQTVASFKRYKRTLHIILNLEFLKAGVYGFLNNSDISDQELCRNIKNVALPNWLINMNIDHFSFNKH